MNTIRKADCEFFSNVDCEFWPCHGIEGQNCLFCYCPLYPFECGGNFTMIGTVKDCSSCTLIHREGGYEYVTARLKAIYADDWRKKGT